MSAVRATTRDVGPGRAIRTAIIGCGSIAHEHLAALSAVPNAQVVAVCDTSAASAEFMSLRYSVERFFTSLDCMLHETRPHVVHVLTPPNTHASIVTTCLEAGCDVVCEKPMTASAQETERLLVLAEESNQILVETRNMLFNDVVVEIDRLCRTGRLGDIREVDVSLCLDLASGPFGDVNGAGVDLPGGAVHDFLPHLAYLALHYIGNDVLDADEVVGVLENRGGNPRVIYDSLDSFVTIGGRRARIHVASDIQPDMFRVRLRGTKGSVETDLYQPYLRVEGGVNTGKRAPFEQIGFGAALLNSGLTNLTDKVRGRGPMHGLRVMLEELYQSIASPTGGPPFITAAEMIASARLVDRLVALGRPS